MRIYCPKCEYEPDASDVWMCNPEGCGTLWNTFDTGGRCPGCSTYWRKTCCPACARWSPHEDWYHDDPDDPQVEELSEEELQELTRV
jgi:hypothetical protein